jgi:hypothetical protein
MQNRSERKPRDAAAENEVIELFHAQFAVERVCFFRSRKAL